MAQKRVLGPRKPRRKAKSAAHVQEMKCLTACSGNRRPASDTFSNQGKRLAKIGLHPATCGFVKKFGGRNASRLIEMVTSLQPRPAIALRELGSATPGKERILPECLRDCE